MTTNPPRSNPWRRWWARHDGRHLLFAAPALLGLAVLVFFVSFVRPSQAALASKYLAEGARCDEQGDRDGARICYGRLQIMQVKDASVRHNLAVNLYRRGDEARALKMLDELAPLGGRGYPPAHVWQAHRLLQIYPQTDEIRDQAKNHLELAVTARGFDDPEAEQLLGETYFKIGVLEQANAMTVADQEKKQDAVSHASKLLARAETVLKNVVARRPEAMLSLARVSARLQKGPDALKLADQVIETNEARLRADPNNEKARLTLADGLLFRDQFQKAIDLLEEGRQLKDSQEYRSALAKVYLSWFSLLRTRPDTPAVDQLERLEKAREYEPDNPDLVEAYQFVIQDDDVDCRVKALEALRKLAVGNVKTSGLAHWVLALYYLQKQPPLLTLARDHLEQAIVLAPYLNKAAATLIYHVLLQLPNPELDKAMSLAHAWVARFPNDPHLRQARAQVYLHLRTRDAVGAAVADLQAALKVMPDAPQLHQELAGAYKLLGDEAMAKKHSDLAEKLMAPRKPEK